MLLMLDVRGYLRKLVHLLGQYEVPHSAWRLAGGLPLLLVAGAVALLLRGTTQSASAWLAGPLPSRWTKVEMPEVAARSPSAPDHTQPADLSGFPSPVTTVSAIPDAPVLPASVATTQAPVHIASEVKAIDAHRWQVKLHIDQRAPGVSTGKVWVVAQIRLANGRIIHLASDSHIDVLNPAVLANADFGLSYKTRWVTHKQLLINLPARFGKAELVGVEAFASNDVTGDVAKFANLAH